VWVLAACTLALAVRCEAGASEALVRDPYAERAPVVDDADLGRSASLPGALVVTLDQDDVFAGWFGGIGKLADAALFAGPGYPWLRLTVAFSCARPDLVSGKGNYANPRSVWYNSFFGFYRIDVRKQAWGRPFGYEPDGVHIRFEDILRLGKADWNYLSNRVYGVPRRFVEANDALDASASTGQTPPVDIGGLRWDPFELRGVRVVSPYASDRDAGLETFDPILTPLWRRAFGTHDPDPDFPKSFPTTPMRSRGYMCFTEGFDLGGRIYSTYVFGGAVRQDFTPPGDADRLLGKQMEALEKVMAAFPPALCLFGAEGCCRPTTP
jgi:hypothetical protein